MASVEAAVSMARGSAELDSAVVGRVPDWVPTKVWLSAASHAVFESST